MNVNAPSGSFFLAEHSFDLFHKLCNNSSQVHNVGVSLLVSRARTSGLQSARSNGTKGTTVNRTLQTHYTGWEIGKEREAR